MAPSAYDDHDLLIRIDTKLDIYSKANDIFQSEIELRVARLEEKYSELRSLHDRQDGFFSGAKWLWGFIGALPPTIVAVILSGKI